MAGSKHKTVGELSRDLRDLKGNVYLLHKRAEKVLQSIQRIRDTIELLEESDWISDGDENRDS